MTLTFAFAKKVIYHVVGWGYATISIVVVAALPGGGFGPEGAWCWISVDHEWARYVFNFVPLVLAIVTVLLNAIAVTAFLRKLADVSEKGVK